MDSEEFTDQNSIAPCVPFMQTNPIENETRNSISNSKVTPMFRRVRMGEMDTEEEAKHDGSKEHDSESNPHNNTAINKVLKIVERNSHKKQVDRNKARKNLKRRAKTMKIILQSKEMNLNDIDVIEMAKHNLQKREQLGNMSLHELRNGNMSTRNIKDIILQSKMIADLKKLRRNNYDDQLEQSDEEPDDPFDMEDFNPGTKDQDQNKKIFRRNYGVEI